MKAEFNLKQEVWFLHQNTPQNAKVVKIIISKEGISYTLGLFASRDECEVGASKEELKNKLFK